MKLFFVRFSTAFDKVAPGGLSQFLRLTPQSIQGGNNGVKTTFGRRFSRSLLRQKKVSFGVLMEALSKFISMALEEKEALTVN